MLESLEIKPSQCECRQKNEMSSMSGTGFTVMNARILTVNCSVIALLAGAARIRFRESSNLIVCYNIQLLKRVGCSFHIPSMFIYGVETCFEQL